MRPASRNLPAALLSCIAIAIAMAGACARRSTLPDALGDREFWSLIESLSEPAGEFTLSDNLVSNEPRFAEIAKWLRPVGGGYIGVGPEQNFSYIAGLRPEIAFIVDIRRENLDLHLLYKALFELSTDRVDFVSLLFSRARPADLTPAASADEIFERYDRIAASPELFDANAARVRERLLETRNFPVPQADLETIDLTLRVFYTAGPAIDYYGSRAATAVRPSYRQLMTSKDFTGAAQSFLASEERFQFVKALQTRNLIVPVVGNFAGPGAMRRAGDYVRQHRNVITAVYGSNVGVYLNSLEAPIYCVNLASLPATTATWFIESDRLRLLRDKLKSCQPEKN